MNWYVEKQMADTKCQRCEIATFNWGQDPLARELFPALRFERAAHERAEQGGTADCGMADSDATWTAGTKEANEIMNWILNDLFGFGNFSKTPATHCQNIMQRLTEKWIISSPHEILCQLISEWATLFSSHRSCFSCFLDGLRLKNVFYRLWNSWTFGHILLKSWYLSDAKSM